MVSIVSLVSFTACGNIWNSKYMKAVSHGLGLYMFFRFNDILFNFQYIILSDRIL